VAVEKHVAEVEALGIRRQVSNPLFDRVASARPITDAVIGTTGNASGGKVEYPGRKVARKYQTISLSVSG
jgi:hypothetical protein